MHMDPLLSRLTLALAVVLAISVVAVTLVLGSAWIGIASGLTRSTAEPVAA